MVMDSSGYMAVELMSIHRVDYGHLGTECLVRHVCNRTRIII